MENDLSVRVAMPDHNGLPNTTLCECLITTQDEVDFRSQHTVSDTRAEANARFIASAPAMASLIKRQQAAIEGMAKDDVDAELLLALNTALSWMPVNSQDTVEREEIEFVRRVAARYSAAISAIVDDRYAAIASQEQTK